MAHTINQHDKPAAAAGFSDDQFAELKRLLKPISEAALATLQDRSECDVPKAVALSDQQFARIEELLQPGYELALKLLAELDGAKPVAAEPSIVDPPVDVGQQG